MIQNSSKHTYTPSAEERILVFDEDQELHQAILQLDKFRHPIVLYYFRELTYEQIADVLNISLPSVKTRLLIVRKKEDQIDLLNVSEFRLIKEENGWRIPLNPTK